MSPYDFVIWLQGFTEACNDFAPTPKQWDKIKEVLNKVENYNDNPDLDEDGWSDWYQRTNTDMPLTGSITTSNPNYTVTVSSGSLGTSVSATVWNDKMGNWHYTNYPEGFGYYHRPDNKKEKQQLND
jgi:phospholipase C